MAEKQEVVSFSFAKKKENKLLSKSKVAEKEEVKEDDKFYVTSLDDKKSLSKKEDLVIPLNQTNRWRNAKKPDELEKDTEDDKKVVPDSSVKGKQPEDEAVQELLQEAAAQNEDWNERGKTDAGYAIPLLLQNKVPEGFETDEKLNLDLRPDEPEEANYDSFPIEQYGMAMLRGMGWSKEKGVGLRNSQNIKPIDAMPRPKGMGLGADRSVTLQAQGITDKKKDDKDQEQLTLKKGAFCMLISGKNKDLYGEVQGLDEGNARVILKLTLSGETITISQFAVKLVTKADYDKYSKYLNKGKADKYKEKAEGRNAQQETESNSDRRKDRKRKHQSRSRSRDRSDEKKDRRSRSRSKDRSKKKHRSEEKKPSSSKSEKSHTNGAPAYHWLRPHLRVRIIDPEYKKGKYYKNKVVIEDVVSLDLCICRTDEGKVLEDLSQSMLETVIPRSDPAYIMITAGKHRGKLGEILQKDKGTCIARIQLLSDRDSVKELSFDHICEYTGDIHAEADF